ncbi:glycosyltransferase family 4 protein [Desulfovibrio inopinatus]|uniref:glycosyltransferase family 4 protein n=1 Tax=Desulfovibrio inopinatus TaxID=102109 RepID=UPI000428CB44
MPPVRVLHVCQSLGLGGTEKTLQYFVEHLDKEAFDPAVFAFSDGERGKAIRAAGIDTFIGKDLFSFLVRIQPDIIHVHRAGSPNRKVLIPIQLYQPKVLVETNVFGRYDPTPLAQMIDCHLYVSHFCLDRLINGLNREFDPFKHRVLYNPVDTDLFRILVPGHQFSNPIVGRVSRADLGKWSTLVYEFLPRIIAQRSDIQFRVVGATKEFEAFVKNRGLSHHVILHKPLVSDMALAVFLGGLSVFAHANDSGESFGMVIAEAMACGLPVITHPAREDRDNAQLELVEDGKTGFVVNTAEDYAHAILWLLNRPDQARLLGEAGRAKAARLYRVQNIVRQLEDVYHELLEKKKAQRIL